MKIPEDTIDDLIYELERMKGEVGNIPIRKAGFLGRIERCDAHELLELYDLDTEAPDDDIVTVLIVG